jgi:hypothetical protein
VLQVGLGARPGGVGGGAAGIVGDCRAEIGDRQLGLAEP